MKASNPNIFERNVGGILENQYDTERYVVCGLKIKSKIHTNEASWNDGIWINWLNNRLQWLISSMKNGGIIIFWLGEIIQLIKYTMLVNLRSDLIFTELKDFLTVRNS